MGPIRVSSHAHLAAADEGDGDGEFALLAAGEGAREGVALAAQAHAVHHVVHLPCDTMYTRRRNDEASTVVIIYGQ